MTSIRAIGSALALALAAAISTGPAVAQQEKTKGRRPGNPIETLASLDANGDKVIEPEEVPESGRPAFDRLLRRGDANKNGKLEFEEMRGLVGRLREAGDGGVVRFRAMDKDGDGNVSRDEFTGPAPLFDRLDADKDGTVTKEEARAFRPPGASPTGRPEQAARGRRVMAMDQDGDGNVSREEFQGPAPLFDRLDADKDGAVTAEEIRKFAGSRDQVPKSKTSEGGDEKAR